MNEKRFFTKINNKGRLVIIDKECHIELFDMALACEVLNRLDLKLKAYNERLGEQQATINKVYELLEEADIFSDKATEHDIKAYIELQEFDNKDAYYLACGIKKAIKLLKGV